MHTLGCTEIYIYIHIYTHTHTHKIYVSIHLPPFLIWQHHEFQRVSNIFRDNNMNSLRLFISSPGLQKQQIITARVVSVALHCAQILHPQGQDQTQGGAGRTSHRPRISILPSLLLSVTGLNPGAECQRASLQPVGERLLSLDRKNLGLAPILTN